jgi:hypothetical protein
VGARAAGADIVLVNHLPRHVGDVRNIGFRHLCGRLGAVGERTWLLSTDADTVVPPTWVLDHLRYAAAGADAVAGAVDLDDPHELPADALARYTALVTRRVAGRTHGHAYAANLGVRGSAFQRVGAFACFDLDILRRDRETLVLSEATGCGPLGIQPQPRSALLLRTYSVIGNDVHRHSSLKRDKQMSVSLSRDLGANELCESNSALSFESLKS